MNKLKEKIEKLTRENKELKTEIDEYKQIFNAFIEKFGNEIVHIFTEKLFTIQARSKNETQNKDLPN